MKSLNHLSVAAAVALTVNVALTTPAGEQHKLAKLTTNKALLHSPRYLEEHPELLRPADSEQREQSTIHKRDSLAKLSANTALAHSPRFREDHPQLLWATSPAEERTAARETHRLVNLTENKALANSPRFREEHPELLRGGPELEIAPLK